MTLSELRTEVKFRVFPESVADTTFDARTNQRINWAIQDIYQRVALPELDAESTLVLSAGQRSYNLPSDLLNIVSVKSVDERRPLAPLTWGEEASIDETEVGEVTHWFRYGSNFIVYPVPADFSDGKAVRLRYRRKLTTLTVDTASSPLPDYCDELIVLGAAYKLHRDQNEVELAGLAYRDYVAAAKAINNFRANEFSMSGGTTRVLR